jgi:hypothetical protein
MRLFSPRVRSWNPLPPKAKGQNTSPPIGGRVDSLTLTDATELLDFLERGNVESPQVSINSDGFFAVRWGETS